MATVDPWSVPGPVLGTERAGFKYVHGKPRMGPSTDATAALQLLAKRYLSPAIPARRSAIGSSDPAFPHVAAVVSLQAAVKQGCCRKFMGIADSPASCTKLLDRRICCNAPPMAAAHAPNSTGESSVLASMWPDQLVGTGWTRPQRLQVRACREP